MPLNPWDPMGSPYDSSGGFGAPNNVEHDGVLTTSEQVALGLHAVKVPTGLHEFSSASLAAGTRLLLSHCGTVGAEPG
jgi:hypothetical protein